MKKFLVMCFGFLILTSGVLAQTTYPPNPYSRYLKIFQTRATRPNRVNPSAIRRPLQRPPRISPPIPQPIPVDPCHPALASVYMAISPTNNPCFPTPPPPPNTPPIIMPPYSGACINFWHDGNIMRKDNGRVGFRFHWPGYNDYYVVGWDSLDGSVYGRTLLADGDAIYDPSPWRIWTPYIGMVPSMRYIGNRCGTFIPISPNQNPIQTKK